MRSRLANLVLILLCSGCSITLNGAKPFQGSFPVEGISGVQILMKRGKASLEGSGADQIIVNGSAESGLDPAINVVNGILQIDFEDSHQLDRIKIDLPADLNIEIQTFDVDIDLVSVEGNLTIRNTAGDILLDDYLGQASLWSGRGDIQVSGGEGKLIVIGEHGNLSVASFSGPVTMTTIMGRIEFSGEENSSGDVLLEVDHGPVIANLPERSDYQIKIDSAGGEIICQGGNLGRTITGCIGSTGDGKSTFKVRTVSGRIEFLILPSLDE